jgi:hypothetical protein
VGSAQSQEPWSQSSPPPCRDADNKGVKPAVELGARAASAVGNAVEDADYVMYWLAPMVVGSP